ncbi:RDD family protein [Marinimicrobium sp. ABcell2]|uniref:RDD family protein n=1 Tax=Marinimicrobium sp. ABcell2 TaxID=3069751 RepID=UPI0027B62AE4|nr:RDD family protein [Marinimicrobium sp. ABcell2]MDQ2077939.1 RDD family protein [Marinimicrobium sp. ABcell2]
MTDEVQQNWIAGFWRRIGALFIDTLILGLVGFLLGLALGSTFVQVGGWGRLIGFVIALVYFGAMNSKLFKGQTIGKRVLNLRVVDSDNQTISLVRSVIRYIVLAAPFSLNGAQFSNEALLSFLIYPLSLIIFGGLFSIIYLYIFNRITRQSLHDLAVGTFVVNANIEKQEVGKIWKGHLVVVAVFFIAAAIVPVFTSKLAQNEPFKDMLAVQSALSDEPGVNYATVTTSTTTFSSKNEGAKTTTYVTAQAFISSNNVSDVELARELAIIVIKNFPEAVRRDALRITLTYGYDIGIWSQWSNHAHDFNPSELAGEEQE